MLLIRTTATLLPWRAQADLLLQEHVAANYFQVFFGLMAESNPRLQSDVPERLSLLNL